jgi:hypothetical protein
MPARLWRGYRFLPLCESTGYKKEFISTLASQIVMPRNMPASLVLKEENIVQQI